jgi:hypothetical protein
MITENEGLAPAATEGEAVEEVQHSENITPGAADQPELGVHQFARLFPRMKSIELDTLADDIQANGLREPIVLYEGKILDGCNRHIACIQAVVEPRYEEFIGDEKAALAFVISKNIHRRHLSPQRRRFLIAELIKTQPEKSDRAIAEQVDASPSTGHRVRRSTASADAVEKRVGKDGKARKQPAKKAKAETAVASEDGTEWIAKDGTRSPKSCDCSPGTTAHAALDPTASAEARKAHYAALDDGDDEPLPAKRDAPPREVDYPPAVTELELNCVAREVKRLALQALAKLDGKVHLLSPKAVPVLTDEWLKAPNLCREVADAVRKATPSKRGHLTVVEADNAS